MTSYVNFHSSLIAQDMWDAINNIIAEVHYTVESSLPMNRVKHVQHKVDLAHSNDEVFASAVAKIKNLMQLWANISRHTTFQNNKNERLISVEINTISLREQIWMINALYHRVQYTANTPFSINALQADKIILVYMDSFYYLHAPNLNIANDN